MSWEDGNHLLLRQDLPLMVERVFTKAEKYLAKAEKYAEAEMGPERWAMAVKNRVAKVAPEASAVDEVNEVAPEVDVDEVDVSEVDVNEVNVNEGDVDEVNEECTMNEDSGEVCDAKEEVRKGKPPEVLLRSDFVAKVQVEKSGMKEVKNLEDVKKVEKGLPLSRSREVKGIEDLIMKTKEESRHASWDPGEIVDAEAQMFNMKVEVMPNGDVNAKALFDAMSLFNFVRLYTFEVLVLVARNAVRFVDVNPLSSRSFAESFPPILSDYG